MIKSFGKTIPKTHPTHRLGCMGQEFVVPISDWLFGDSLDLFYYFINSILPIT